MDGAILLFPEHRGLHPVVEHLFGDAAYGLEGHDVAAQHRLQLLVGAEPTPQPAAVAQHAGEQPELAANAGLIGEFDHERSEVDLGLAARRGLETALEAARKLAPDLAQAVGHRRVSPGIAEGGDVAIEPPAGQTFAGRDPLAKIVFVRLNEPRPRRTRTVERVLEPAFQVVSDRLAVQACCFSLYFGTFFPQYTVRVSRNAP